MASRALNRSLSRRVQFGIIVGGTLAGTVVTLLLWSVFNGFGYESDFVKEAWHPYVALGHDHFGAFVQTGPAYIGSLLMRAPFVVPALALGGGWKTVYYASAVPCLAAPPILAAWLAGRVPRRDGLTLPAWLIVLIPVLLDPMGVFCLILGHPEELLGASLSIAAVVLAAEGERPQMAGLLLGLTLVNKPSALVVVPVVLAVMPRGRMRAVAAAAATAAILYAPILYVHLTDPSAGVGASLGSGTGELFFPAYLGWWLGPHSWFAKESHPLIPVAATAVCIVWRAIRHGSQVTPERHLVDALWLLAFVFLLRCALDPWDNVYYAVPCVMTLAVLEMDSEPRITVAVMLLLFVAVRPIVILPASFDVRAIQYEVIATPIIVLMGLRAVWSEATFRAVIRRLRTPVSVGARAARSHSRGRVPYLSAEPGRTQPSA